MTALYGVVGNPIAHSLSPFIHQGWMREHGIDAEYLPIQVAEGELERTLAELTDRGYQGLNITMPHKREALRLAATATTRAQSIGAANTLWREGDRWHADNTDAPGFQHGLARAFGDLDVDRDLHVPDEPALVVGAGGAALAVAYTFGDDNQATTFCNRTVANAEQLVSVYDAIYAGNPARFRNVAGMEALPALLKNCAFVVNATSLGHMGQSLDWPEGCGRLVYDLSYGKAADIFLAPARDAGWQTVDGLRMLVAQAAFSFRRWFGVKPDIEATLVRVREVVETA